MLANSKLNTIHSHISKALEDTMITDEEYKLILEEVEKYRTVKDEMSQVCTPIVDGDKNKLLRRGHQ